MTDREKIIKIIADNRECFPDIDKCDKCRNKNEIVGTANYCTTYKIADALIAAGIGDITAWKERAEKAEERLEKLKKTEGDLTVEEEINILENLFEEAKHRFFVFEEELVKYKIAFDKAIKLAYKIRTDFDVLSCSSCEFGYAIDVCKKTGLYSDRKNRWKEELLQQAQREIEGGKGE